MLTFNNQIIDCQEGKCLYCNMDCIINPDNSGNPYKHISYTCKTCGEFFRIKYLYDNKLILISFSCNGNTIWFDNIKKIFYLWKTKDRGSASAAMVRPFIIDFSNKEKLLQKIKMCFIFQ